MKYIIIIALALSVLAFTKSSSVNSSRPFANNSDTSKPLNKTIKKNNKEPIFDYPEYIETDTGRARFVKEFNKGRIIYKQTCAKCHNVTKDGKLYYPDFSIPQLIDYEMRIQYSAHEDELKETNLSPLEFDWVVLFLQYKKKNLALTAK